MRMGRRYAAGSCGLEGLMGEDGAHVPADSEGIPLSEAGRSELIFWESMTA